MLKLYKITWRGTIYAESSAEANSMEEAKKLAEQGEDKDFEIIPESMKALYRDTDWEIDSVEAVDEQDNPKE